MPEESRAREERLAAVLSRICRKYETAFEPLEVDGKTLEVLSVTNMRECLDSLIRRHAIKNPLKDLPLWAKVWPGSFVLGRYLRKLEPAGKTLLDIGCGCGVCGLVAAGHGFSSVILADIEEDALDFARANILRNGLEDVVRTRFLDVASGSPESPCDIIAASELLYLEELHRPVLKFVERGLASGGRAVFCTDLARVRPRFAKLARQKFKVAENRVGVKSVGGDGTTQMRGYEILTLERK